MEKTQKKKRLRKKEKKIAIGRKKPGTNRD
jgi:hypothetical protein